MRIPLRCQYDTASPSARVRANRWAKSPAYGNTRVLKPILALPSSRDRRTLRLVAPPKTLQSVRWQSPFRSRHNVTKITIARPSAILSHFLRSLHLLCVPKATRRLCSFSHHVSFSKKRGKVSSRKEAGKNTASLRAFVLWRNAATLRKQTKRLTDMQTNVPLCLCRVFFPPYVFVYAARTLLSIMRRDCPLSA